MVVCAALLVAPVLAQDSMGGLSTGQHPTLGNIVVDANGKTVYTLSADSPGVSTCSGACANAWPPVLVDPAMAGAMMTDASMQGVGTLQREDGSMQLTINGMPLYGFVRDTQPGDANGQGVNAFGGTWSVVPGDQLMGSM